MNVTLRNILLTVILGVGFFLRFTHGFFRHIMYGITFITPDPYYHVRRIVLTAQHFPHLPSFDYYLSYPVGTHCIWPPLYDFLCACIAYVIGFGNPSVQLIEFVAAVYPILFGLAVVLLTYVIGRNVFNEYVGIIAAAIVSFVPASVIFSNFGFTDHHIAESFSLLLIFYCFLRERDDVLKFVIAGVSIGIALLFWQGSILFAGIIFFYLFFSRKRYTYTFLTYVIPLVMIIPLSLESKFIGGYFAYRGLSLLHIFVLGVMGFLVYLKYSITNRKMLYAVSGVIALLFVAFIFPKINEALNVVMKNPWTETIVAYQSLISVTQGYISTTTANEFYGRLYFLWPIIIILLIRDKYVKHKSLFVYLTIVIGIFNLLVIQYSVWFAPFYAMLVGYLFYSIYNFLRERLTGTLKFLIIPILGILLFIGYQSVFVRYRFTFENMPTLSEHAAYLWLRDSTEKTSHFTEPTQRPEYGVMSFYKHGHMIIYLGQRPAIANNFGKDAPQFDVPNTFMLCETEDEANNILSEYNARYIYLDHNLYEMYLAAQFLNLDARSYFEIYSTTTEQGKPTTALTLKPKALKTVYYRLLRFNGCRVYIDDSIYIEPIRQSRLVYVSPTERPIKIYEFVEGATIMGKIRPHTPIYFFIPVDFGYFSFMWADSLMSDNHGNFTITSPYATDTMPAMVIVGIETTSVHISDKDVRQGNTLRLDL
jgi:dolichyl-diphosphooligosaccharide--protein glycosyltransferase